MNFMFCWPCILV